MLLQLWLYFLRKLRSFNVCSNMLHIFCQSVVASAIFFAAICWSSSIRASDSKTPNKVIKKAGTVLGTALEPLELERRMLFKLLNVMGNTPIGQTTVSLVRGSFSSTAIRTISRGHSCPLQ